MSQDNRPIFKIKKDTLTRSISAFRVTDSMANSIERLQREYGIPQNEVIKQMIQFALDHAPSIDEVKKENEEPHEPR